MVPWYRKVALNMPDTGKIDDNFTALRKGLLEFAVLSTVSHSKVYAADILDKLARCCLGSSAMATLRTNGQKAKQGHRANTTASLPKENSG